MKTATLAAGLVALAFPVAAKSPLKQPKERGSLQAAFEGTAFAGDGDTINFIGMHPSVRLWGHWIGEK